MHQTLLIAYEMKSIKYGDQSSLQACYCVIYHCECEVMIVTIEVTVTLTTIRRIIYMQHEKFVSDVREISVIVEKNEII